MAFWGIEVKPGTPYVYPSGDNRGRLHVSQATLGLGDGCVLTKNILQCKVGDMNPIFLCSLLPGRLETCQLNLEFEEDDEVTFSTVDPRSRYSMHLSGFFYRDRDDQDDLGHDCDSDSSDEDFVVNGFKEEDDSEDDYDYIDDGLEMYPPSAIQNSGEIVDDEKVNNENDSSKQKTDTSKALTKSAETNGENTLKKSVKGDAVHGNKLKKKIDTIDLDGNPARESIEKGGSAVQSGTILPENDEVRKKIKNLKVADKVEAGLPNYYATIKSPAAKYGNDLNPSSENNDYRKKEKKNVKGKQKKNKQPGRRQTPSAEENSTNGNVLAQEKQEKKEAKSSQVRAYRILDGKR